MNRKWTILVVGLSAILFAGCSVTSGNSKGDTQKKQETVAEDTENPKLVDGLYKKFYKPKYYEKYFEDEFSEYRIDDVSQWKDADGNWCYPKEYELGCTPGRDEFMAGQQFPKELVSSMDTAELYDFVLNAPGDIAIVLYDDYLAALTTYRTYYNYIDELMGREDFPSVVHDRYESYSKEEVAQMTKENHASSPDLKTWEQFQLTEAFERFYTGKLVPQKVD